MGLNRLLARNASFWSLGGGQAIKFDESQARAMGRTATGVRGIKLDSGDEVLGMEVTVKGADLLVITEKGYGKKTPMDQYPTQGRGGKGVRTLKVSSNYSLG